MPSAAESRVHGALRENSVQPPTDKTKRLSLIDLVGLQNIMSDVLGVEADLCDADRLKEHIQSNFDREAELVF